MCGIAGILGHGDRSTLDDMTTCMRHRGPDDVVASEPGPGLLVGHCRLSVIDHVGGRQPMQSPDGLVTLLFNGEIYNHRSIRRELTSRGHRFMSDHSDTEAVLHAYLEWGDQMLARFNGMFAVAVIDQRDGSVLLARDRFGEKPLFYAHHDRGLVFASEMRAIMLHPDVNASRDGETLRKLLAYGFIPGPRTSRRGVKRVPPGGIVRTDLMGRDPVATRYWRFESDPDIDRVDDDLLSAIAERIDSAVRRRMESDVPLGVLLSGGLDSSTVASIASSSTGDRIKTFHAAFDNPSFDESAHARLMARSIDSDHHEWLLRTADLEDLATNALERLDEPLGDASYVPTYHLMRLAREHVTVALTGDGADELFGGYDPFLALAPTRMLDAGPDALRRVTHLAARLVPAGSGYMSPGFRLSRFSRGLSRPAAERFVRWTGPADAETIARVTGTHVDPEHLYSEALESWESTEGDDAERLQAFFVNLYLPDNILVKSDSASMAHSLEARSVFLDNDVVDLARRIPARLKFSRTRTKTLLAAAVRDLVPPQIHGRRKKGFGVPIFEWRLRMEGGRGGEGSSSLLGSEDRTVDERLFWLDLVLRRFGITRSEIHEGESHEP